LAFRPEGRCGRWVKFGSAAARNVHAFAVEGNLDTDAISSNTFEMEWPPRSGRLQSFPEVDRAEWLDLARAREKILASQQPLLDRLDEAQGVPDREPEEVGP
jgi:predicted NUDIX family NTP pyrophosphohydrolase